MRPMYWYMHSFTVRHPPSHDYSQWWGYQKVAIVLHVATRLMTGVRRNEHITPTLRDVLQWLPVKQRITYKIATMAFSCVRGTCMAYFSAVCIQFKMAVLTYKVLHGTVPRYLRPLARVADLPGRRGLHSADTNRLAASPYKLSIIVNRSFKVASAQTRNSLPEDVTSSPTLSTFRRRLKTHLFRLSYPDVVMQ